LELEPKISGKIAKTAPNSKMLGHFWHFRKSFVREGMLL
jgi:hypothetical protein